jgi:hypothetical protein
LRDAVAQLDAEGAKSPFDLFCRHVGGGVGGAGFGRGDDVGGDGLKVLALGGSSLSATASAVRDDADVERKTALSRWLQLSADDKDVYNQRFRERIDPNTVAHTKDETLQSGDDDWTSEDDGADFDIFS